MFFIQKVPFGIIYIYIYIQPSETSTCIHECYIYTYIHTRKLNNIGTDGCPPVITSISKHIYIYLSIYIYIHMFYAMSIYGLL
jgi:hypothetical protein